MEFFQTPDNMPRYKQAGWDSNQLGDVPILGLTIAFTTFIFLLELLLDIRQYDKLDAAYKSKKIPKELVGIISAKTFHKANDYGVDKFKFGILESVILFVEGMLLIIMGYLPWAWDTAATGAINVGILTESSSVLYTEIVITFIFILILTIHDTVLSLPFSLFKNFVIEENHGFNKSTMYLFFYDKAMGLGLTVVLGFPIIAIIVGLVRWGGEYFYFYVWSFLFVISILMLTIYPTLIAPLFNKYTKLDKGPIYDAISKLAADVSFPLSMIFLVDGSKRSNHSNAYFYGFFKNKRIVIYDTLIEQVALPELLAILGHEIGHWQLSHALQGFVIGQLYTFSLFLAFSCCQNTPSMFAAFGFRSSGYPMPVLVGLVLFSQTFWSPVEKVLSLVMNYNSRCNEFAADQYALKLGMGDALGRGLVKISTENLGNMVPDSWYSTYHFSHPPLVERLRALKLKEGALDGISMDKEDVPKDASKVVSEGVKTVTKEVKKDQ